MATTPPPRGLSQRNGRTRRTSSSSNPDLDAAFADPGNFGYGRIAVLDATLRDGVTRVSVARVTGKPMILIAGAVKQGDEVKSLVMVALPTDNLASPITDAGPGSGYISLDFHGYNVASTGNPDVSLLGKTSSLKLLDNGFMVKISSPQPAESFFGIPPIVGYVLLLLFAAGGGALLKYGHTLASGVAKADGEGEGHLTMAEALAAEPQPEKKAAIRDPQRAAVAIAREIFRAYDIRGVVGKSLDAGRRQADRPGNRQCDAGAGTQGHRGRTRWSAVRPGNGERADRRSSRRRS